MVTISKSSTISITKAALTLKAGNLVAFPTETVYGLGADASNPQAIARIYKSKGRPIDHPLIVHISSINNLYKWAKNIPEYALNLAIKFWPGPMTLILPRTDQAKDFITGGQENIGIRVPKHKIAQLLLKKFELQGGLGIAAPSANRFGKVSPTCAEDVYEELSSNLESKDIILDGGTSEIGIESTILDCTTNSPKLLRAGSITTKMVNELLGTNLTLPEELTSLTPKVSGQFESHYAPRAKVFLDGEPNVGDGLIALNIFPTPRGVIRISSPRSSKEFAKILYKSLRLADSHNLKRVYVIPPIGDGIAIAIRDRLDKSKTKD